MTNSHSALNGAVFCDLIKSELSIAAKERDQGKSCLTVSVGNDDGMRRINKMHRVSPSFSFAHIVKAINGSSSNCTF